MRIIRTITATMIMIIRAATTTIKAATLSNPPS